MSRRRWSTFLIATTLVLAGVGAGSAAVVARADTGPVVTSLSVRYGPSSGGTTVNVVGSGFTTTSSVAFFPLPAAEVTFVSSTRLQVVSPDMTAYGDAPMQVVVTTNGFASPTGTASTFNSVAPLQIDSISPRRGDPAGQQVVTLAGSGFQKVSSVTFGSVPAARYKVVSPRRIDVTTPAGAAATVPVAVVTAFGTSRPRAAAQFTYTDAPTISTLTPNRGSARGGFAASIAGTHLRRTTAVWFGQVRGNFTVASDRSISVVVPPGVDGRTPVRVVTSDHGASQSAADGSYFYYQTVPTVTGVSPRSGPVGGGNQITVTGTGFGNISRVLVGGSEVPFTLQSGTSLTIVAPARRAGTTDITVTTLTDTSTMTDADQYTYVETFAISALSPTRGPVGGGTVAVITGVGMSTVTSVRFDDTPVGFQIDSDTQLSVTEPAHSPGIVGVYLSDGVNTVSAFVIYVGDTLYPGQSLTPASSLESPNGNWHATMQTSGALTVGPMNNPPSWTSGSGVSGSTVRLQSDGNLVVYGPDGTAQWSSASAPAAAGRLTMQDDGNLVMYSRGGLAIWSSNTGRLSSADTLGTGQGLASGQELWSVDGGYHASMQGDGNFVVYRSSDSSVRWNSGTSGNAGATVVMQGDGNLVVYRTNGQAAWSSSTAPTSNARLVMQADGNLVIYNGAGQAVWSNGAVLGGGGSSNAAAVAWAKAHLGQVYGTAAEQPAESHQWSGYCWTFVYDAYGGKVPRQPTAQAGFDYYNARGMIHGGQPPAGAIAFYSYGSDGHAAVAIEGGAIIGTHGSSTDRFANYQTPYNGRGLPFLGWAMP